MSTPKKVLLVDIGGTNTRLATPQGRHVRPITHFPTEEQAVREALAEHSKNHDDISISVAGPVFDGVARITFNEFSISACELQRHFRQVILLNDYEAAAYGLMSMRPTDYSVLKGKPDPKKGQLLFGIGTGVGISFRYQSQVHATEAGFATLRARGVAEQKYLDWRQEHMLRNDLHSLLARDAVPRLLEYKTGKAEEWSANQTSDFFKHDSHGMLEVWTSLLAQALQELALSFKPEGGLFLTGGTLHRYASNIDWHTVQDKFYIHPEMGHLLARTPIAMLNQERVLEGCFEAYAQMQKKSV